MASIYRDYYFSLSCDLNLELKVYVDHLDIAHLPEALQEYAEDLLVTIRVIDGGAPVTSGVRATHTPYRDGDSVFWDEWVVLPVKIKDLSKTSQLVRSRTCASHGADKGAALAGGPLQNGSPQFQQPVQRCGATPTHGGGV